MIGRRFAFVFAVLIVVLAVLVYLFMPGAGRPPAKTPSPIYEKTDSTPPAPAKTENPALTPVENPATGVEVSGRVLDKSGQGVPEVQLRIEAAGLVAELSKDLPSAIRSIAEGASDSDGKFTLYLSSADADFTLAAYKQAYAPLTRVVRVPSQGVKDLELVLQPAASISGDVVDLQGKPLEHVCILASGTTSTKTILSSPSNQRGAFNIPDLGPDSYRLQAKFLPPQRGKWKAGLFLGGDKPYLTEVNLGEGEQKSGVRLVVPWTQEDAIEGLVSDAAGKPLEGAYVWATRPESPTESPLAGFGQSGPDGRYKIATLRAAAETRDYTMDVSASLSGYENGVCKNVMPGTTNANIVLSAEMVGTIQGQVLARQSRTAVADAQVLLWNVSKNDGTQKSFYGSEMYNKVASGGARVDGDGRFTIERVPVGGATLLVESKQYGFANEKDLVVRPDEITNVEVLLDEPGRLEVNVLYTGSLEGQRAQCEVMCRQKGAAEEVPQISTFLQETFTGEECAPDGLRDAGMYAFSLPPGAYDVIVSSMLPAANVSRGFRKFDVEIRSGTTTSVDAEVGGAGAIAGFIRKGEADKSLRLYLTEPPELDPGEYQDNLPKASTLLGKRGLVQSCTPSDDGAYAFNSVPDGNYILTVLAESASGGFYMRDTKQVTVKVGDVLEVDFL